MKRKVLQKQVSNLDHIMNRNKTIISFLLLLVFTSCQKDENLDRETEGRFNNTPFQWDYVATSATEDQTFIGDRFISVENRFNIAPPILYVGSVCNKKDFGVSFAPEILSARNPIDVIFNFTMPFFGTINRDHGSVGYFSLLSECLHSTSYKTYIKNRLSPYDARLTEIYSSQDIIKAIPNNTVLSKIISDEFVKESSGKNIKSRLFGELRNKSFRVHMDYPTNGFFKDSKGNENENAIYVRSLTYGKVAYFAIESSYKYEDIENIILSKIGLSNNNNKEKEILEKSKITLFTITDNMQTAKVFKTFEKLDTFINTTFNENNYGYPIYCEGNYVKDNSEFLGR